MKDPIIINNEIIKHKNTNVLNDKHPRLLNQVQDRIRAKHYSIRTEQAYLDWVKKFILYYGKRHPADMSRGQISV